MNWMKVGQTIYEAIGVPYPQGSLLGVTVFGALLFGGGWLFLAQQYKRNHHLDTAALTPSPLPSTPVTPTPAPLPPATRKTPYTEHKPESKTKAVRPPSIEQHTEAPNSSNTVNATTGGVRSTGQTGGVTAGTVGVVVQAPLPDKETESRKEEIQVKLAAFISEGNSLKAAWIAELRSDESTQEGRATAISSWHRSVYAYLGSLPRGVVYQARFENQIPSAIFPDGIYLKHQGTWSLLLSDLRRLDEIMNDPNLGK